MTVDPRNFLLNTDYPLDKVVYITSGSATVANATVDLDLSTAIRIAHGLPFRPLPILLWSNTSDFAITNEQRDADYLADAFGAGAGQYYLVHADATNIYIKRYNQSGGSKTLYYRIFCFLPSDADEDSVAPSTQVSGSDFVLNTDYNYMKLFHDGILTTTGNTYTHNLGYVPRVQVWEETADTTVSRLVLAQDISGGVGNTGVYITDTQLVWVNPGTYSGIHYRIYCDA